MNTTKKAKHYFGGIPTDADIQTIMAYYPADTLTVGELIPYEDIEALIGVKRGTSRWDTVTRRWRKQVEQDTQRVIIGVRRGRGFVVLADDEKVTASQAKLETAARACRRGLQINQCVNRNELTEQKKWEYDRTKFVQSQILLARQTAAKAQLPQ